MLPFEEKVYVDKIPHDVTLLLGADIGGTNSNFGFFKKDQNTLTLIFSLHIKSQTITDFAQTVKDLLDYVARTYGISVRRSSFAAAGVVSEAHDHCKPTNLAWAIDSKEILSKTDLECAFVANDFEVIGHGLNLLNPKNLVKINEGAPRLHANKAIIGAGTGLGKCTMFWDVAKKRYMPMASEGGHGDFPSQSPMEFDFVEFVKKNENRAYNISWEDVLSGDGIERMYHYFSAGNGPLNHGKGPHPDKIFNSRHEDAASGKTFEFYTKVYARCAKNFALDMIALGGVYIAGGIAAKNLPMFELPIFMEEFINCGKQQELLKQVPVYVITDYNVSLYGAAEYMRLEGLCD